MESAAFPSALVWYEQEDVDLLFMEQPDERIEHMLPSYLSSALTSSWGQAENATGTDRCTLSALLFNVPSTASVSGLIITATVLPGIIYLRLTLKKNQLKL